MILFKSCPRCGGDVDATYIDDAYCVQCSHRPEVAYPGPRVVEKAADASESTISAEAASESGIREAPDLTGSVSQGTASPCPRCGLAELVRLDRLRVQDNTCYRCQPCGHVFSPATGRDSEHRQTTTP